MGFSTEENTVVHVALGERAYDIVIGERVLDAAGIYLADKFPKSRFGIVTDTNVAAAQLPRLIASLDAQNIQYSIIEVAAGEKSKDFPTLISVVDGILSARLERGDVIIALGGGVIGDLAGFAASVARRGMDFVQIPTSLLAQVDSSVGGKTGINSSFGKNLVGAFYQPKLVLADLHALNSLPSRQLRAGYAEVVKYGLIDDRPFFDWLDASSQSVFDGGIAREEAVAHACRAKARVVVADEHENGARALLNLGHTFGHALEKATGYSDRLLHGEGVSIGCVLAFQFSVQLGLCSEADALTVEAHFNKVGLPTEISDIAGDMVSAEELVEIIAQDKKVSRGELTFILTRGIGDCFIAKNVAREDVLAFLKSKLI